MNIILFTPIYKIEGRESLQRDTEAIHNLIKYWSSFDEVDIWVIDTYLNPARNIKFLFQKGELKNYKNDFEYVTDGVKVHLTEIQQLPNQSEFWNFQKKKIIRAFNEVVIKHNFKPDLIIAHCPIRYFDIFKSFKGKCPVVGVLHYTDIHYSTKYPKCVKKINEQFDFIYARSKVLRDKAKKMGLKKVSDFIISSGVPFANVLVNKSIDFTKREANVLYVGKLMQRKHLDFVIQALAALKENYNFHLYVIGIGEEKEKLMQLVEGTDMTNRVSFLGSMPREQVYYHMANADIFIMPSVRETLGLVYIEAMMHGCITVGTKFEGIDGIISDGENGFLVEPESLDSVVNVLRKIMNMDAFLLNKISENALKTAQYYNEPDLSRYYLEEMKSLVNFHDDIELKNNRT